MITPNGGSNVAARPCGVKRAACSGVVLLASLTFPTARLAAQACDAGPRWSRAALIGGGFAATQAIVIVARHDAWWTTPTTGFHFTSGGSASKEQDKLLHGAIAYHVSQASAFAWDWACFPRTTAGWLGAALGVLVGLPKEIGDGLHEDKGFATDDFAAGLIGAALPALHRSAPVTRAVLLKMNYWPSDEFRNSAEDLPDLENDYAGQRYFLAINPGRAPGGAGPWPDWLGVAVGHSVPHWATLPPVHEWYVTLDLNLRGLPIRASWWHTVASVLDQIHFPLPGLRLVHGEIEVGLW